MKKGKKFFALLMTALLMLGISVPTVNMVFADGEKDAVLEASEDETKTVASDEKVAVEPGVETEKSVVLENENSAKEDEKLESAQVLGGVAVAVRATPKNAPKSIQGTISFRDSWLSPQEQGKKKTLYFVLILQGKNKANGQVERFSSKIIQVDAVLGTDTTFELPITDEMQNWNGSATYTDVSPDYGERIAYNTDSHSYGFSSSTTDPYKPRLFYEQNMNSKVKTVIDADGIILEKDKGNIPVEYTVKKTNTDDNTVEYPYTNRNGKPILSEINIKDSEDIQLYRTESFYRAIRGNQLYLSFEGGKRTRCIYDLMANFGGDDKDRLNKLYSLDKTGDEISGFTVTLKSKIKKKVETKEETIPFKTVYKDDPNLPFGEEKVEVEGKNGMKSTEITTLYILNDQNKEEAVETPKEKVMKDEKPVDKVILRGKKAPVLNSAPTISAKDVTLTVGDMFDPLAGVMAEDMEDGKIVLTKDNVIANDVDTSKEGMYHVTYKITDSSNISAEKTIVVTVKAKEKDPTVNEDMNNDKKPDAVDKNNNKDMTNKDKMEKKTVTNAPNTGDATQLGMYGIIALVGMLVIVSIKKHEKANRK